MFEVQINPDIFIRGVGACVGVAQSGRCNGQLQVMHERIARARSPNQGDQLHRHLKHFLGCLGNELNKRLIRIRAGWWVASQVGDVHIAKAFGIKVRAQLLQNIGGMLVGYETKIHFC